MACRPVRIAITVAQLYLFRMLHRTLPAGFIAPCLPIKTTTLPSGSQLAARVLVLSARAACERWPGTPITLRHGARVIEDSRRLRVLK
jgi:hypothetical protein